MLKRFATWLARFTGVMPSVEQARLHSGGDAVERGARWEMFYREEGGLADMLDAIRREAFEAAAELDPNDTAKIYYWATADRNIRKLQARIEGVVVSGKFEAERRKTLAQHETMARLRAVEF